MSAISQTMKNIQDDMAFITGFTQLTDKWFYKLIQLGEFPKPIKLGRSSRWLQSEVEAWVLQR
ncbi:helix-turn-helix transcriptional regulator, partial [Yersinia enterocolitica]|nr:AlpA family phage regulatory protein [Yersinia enterocolitica]